MKVEKDALRKILLILEDRVGVLKLRNLQEGIGAVTSRVKRDMCKTVVIYKK